MKKRLMKTLRWVIVYVAITSVAVATLFTLWISASYINVVSNNVVEIGSEHTTDNIADWNAFKRMVEAYEEREA